MTPYMICRKRWHSLEPSTGQRILMVREKRLELLRNIPLDPKSSAFTSSATLAKKIAKDFLIQNHTFCKQFFREKILFIGENRNIFVKFSVFAGKILHSSSDTFVNIYFY